MGVCKVCGRDSGRKKYCSKECAFDDAEWIIDEENWCWNWSGGKDSQGYGKFYFEGGTLAAHRFACEAIHGKAPEDKPYVLHACDNKKCINPAHLRWGNHQENMKDKTDRGLQARGEKMGTAKLKNSDVIDIKSKLKDLARGDYEKLAEEYNVSVHCIRHIHDGTRWAWLQ